MSEKILVSEISPLSPEARAHFPATSHADESEAKWFARLGLTGQGAAQGQQGGLDLVDGERKPTAQIERCGRVIDA